MMFLENSSTRYPDVYDELIELEGTLVQFNSDVRYMENSTDDDYGVKHKFKNPEQAYAYIGAIQDLIRELIDLHQRFQQISGIED